MAVRVAVRIRVFVGRGVFDGARVGLGVSDAVGRTVTTALAVCEAVAAVTSVVGEFLRNGVVVTICAGALNSTAGGGKTESGFWVALATVASRFGISVRIGAR